MAITATVTVVGPGGNTGTVIIGQNLQAQFAITNSNATGANLVDIVPFARVTGSGELFASGPFSFGAIVIGPNSPMAYIAPGATVTVPVSVSFSQSSSFPIVPIPSVNSGTQNNTVNSNNTYDVGGTIYLSDSVTPTTQYVVSPTATTVTVNTVPLPCSN